MENALIKPAGRFQFNSDLQFNDITSGAQLNADAGGAGFGWILDGEWINDSGSPIQTFRASWLVPEAPQNNNGQVLFIYNGIQSADHLVQCVLQWGESQAGGGDNWSVACWHVTNDIDHPKLSGNIQVNAGDQLNAAISFVDQGDGSHVCQLAFENIPGTELTTSAMPVLSDCCLVLEAYSVTSTQDYPALDITAIEDVQIELANGNIATPVWQARDLVSDFGQHMEVISNSRVNIHYRSLSTPQNNGSNA